MPGKHAKPKNPVKREPVMVASVAGIVVTLAALFGFDLDRDTAGALVSLAIAAFGLWARAHVTPVDGGEAGRDVVNRVRGNP